MDLLQQTAGLRVEYSLRMTLHTVYRGTY